MGNKRNRNVIPQREYSKPSSLRERSQFVSITYEAPLPPPTMLAEYEQVMPGISERLVTGMEQQRVHRQGLENRKIDADIASERKGQNYAFAIAALALIGSFYLIATGKDRAGIYLFITTFASLVTVFVIGKVKQSRDLAQKRKELKQLLPHPIEK